MAGTRGPIGKRDGERVRRNLPTTPTDTVTAIGAVIAPELDIDNPHPIAKALYESMKTSGQAKFYEPSDWEVARMTLYFMNELLWAPNSRGSAQKLATLHQMMTSLLLTEGDRRRAQIEVARNQEADSTVIDVASIIAERLAQG